MTPNRRDFLLMLAVTITPTITGNTIGANVKVEARVSDPGGTLSKVVSWYDSNAGKDMAFDGTLWVTTLFVPKGWHTIHARAIDQDGLYGDDLVKIHVR